MRPPVRPPRLRCALFPLICLPHLLVLPATFWTSSCFADLSVFPSLICGSCSSGQGFAYSFLQIPPRNRHTCCSAMYFVVAYAYSGLLPFRACPWRANLPSPCTAGDLHNWKHLGADQTSLPLHSRGFILSATQKNGACVQRNVIKLR